MDSSVKPLREVVQETVRAHLQDFGGYAMGQCLTAVGWVGGTLPQLYEADGMIELSMADVAGGGFAVGAALAGKRPIYIIRYQGFNWFNAVIPINYAAKSKELWGKSCPMFIRSIAMEGGIGPVAGSSHHALYYRMPGIKIFSPMTPNEYRRCYELFMNDDDVYYISEHRGSYHNSTELPSAFPSHPFLTLFPISITRFAAVEAARRLAMEGISIGVCHLFELKPLSVPKEGLECLKRSVCGGIVIDDDYPDGIAKSIAFDIAQMTGSRLDALGLKPRSAGFASHLDNLPPSADEIVDHIRHKATSLGYKSMTS